MLVTSNKALVDQLAAIVAAVLDTSVPAHTVVKLAQGAFTPSPGSDPSTFTEADYTGYASKTISAWTPPSLRNDGSAEVVSTTVLDFSPSGTITVTNIITGYWLVGGNGDYLGGEVLPFPVPLAVATDSLKIVPVWQVAPSTWGANLLP